MTFYCSNPACARRWENFTAKARAKNVKCPACRRPATQLKRVRPGTSVGVIPDFPTHWNHSLGMVIKNRAHHRQIQKERGLQDWQPTGNSPGSQLSLGRKQ